MYDQTYRTPQQFGHSPGRFQSSRGTLLRYQIRVYRIALHCLTVRGMDSSGVIAEAIEKQLKVMFDPKSPNPPLCGTCEPVVELFGGDIVPLDNVGNGECGCGNPLLWVRFARRFHTTNFPAENPDGEACGKTPVVVFEVGVARCVETGEMHDGPSLEDRRREMFCLMDDAWRIDTALCRAGAIVMRDHVALAYSISGGEPAGPEGGLVVWTQTITVQLAVG